MSKKAAAVKQWIENRRRFANLFNAKIYNGAEVVKPEDLEPIEGETHILLELKDGKRQEIHRYRDVTMRWKEKMNLIDAARVENLEVFQKDLQVILGLLKCRKDKNKLKQYVEDNKEFFKSVDMDTGMAISSFINSESVMKMLENQKEEKGDEIDMCKAMEDWAAEERLEGKLEGEENKLVDQIRKKLAKGKVIVTIADEIEETEAVVKQLMEKYNL